MNNDNDRLIIHYFVDFFLFVSYKKVSNIQ